MSNDLLTAALAFTTEQIEAFAGAIFAPDEIIEVRRLPSRHSTWHEAGELAAQAATLLRDNAAGENIYVGANSRKAVGGTKAADVALARCLFADFDHVSIADAHTRLDASPLPTPTLLVNSGHGVHAWWRVAEPITDLAAWSEIQRNLIALLGSDPAIHDPPRIMRLPGFMNHKPPPARCEIVECEPSRAFEWHELLPLIQQRAANGHASSNGDRVKSEPIADELRPSERHAAFVRLAGAMRRQGADTAEILAALRVMNQQRCKPPHPDAKLREVAADIAGRYATGDTTSENASKTGSVTVSPFPVVFFPSPLAEYVAQAAAALGCDPAYVGVPMLPVIASAIGNTRRVRLKDTWTEPPVIWCATVGESGTVKSPALELATRPIWKRQAALLRMYAKARAEHDRAMKEWKATPKRGEPPEAPEPCEHPICSDITVEALADRLQSTPRGTLIALDELSGWFGSFNQYKKSGSDVAHWLALHGARALKVDRKTGDKTTIYVPHAAVSLTGTIQPDTLRRALLPEFFDNGLTARLLVTMPPLQPKRWSEREISDATALAVDRLFDCLFALQPDCGVNGDEPKMIDLSPDALSAWIAFVNQHGAELDVLHGHARAAAAKLEGYAARFALVRHCVRHASGDMESPRIDSDDIAAGIALAKWFGGETLRVYRLLHRAASDNPHRELVAWIEGKGGRATVRDVQRGLRRYRDNPDQAERDLNELVAAAVGAWQFIAPGKQGGQPTREFVFFRSDTGDGDTTPKNFNDSEVVSPVTTSPESESDFNHADIDAYEAAEREAMQQEGM